MIIIFLEIILNKNVTSSQLLAGEIQGGIQKFQDFIKKTKNWFSFANILLVAFEIVPFALNTTICTIKKIIE